MLVLLVAVVMGGLTLAHVKGINGPYYWMWPWRRLQAWKLYPLMALAAVPFFVGQWLYHRNQKVLIALALAMISTFALELAAISQEPLGLGRIGALVENSVNTSYYTAAKVLVHQQQTGIKMSEWLELYPDLLPFMQVHARFKPPGLVLYYVAIIHLFGEGVAGQMIGGLLIGAAATLAVPATYRLIRTLGRDEQAAFCGASFMALCPSLVLFFPQYDQLYPTLAVLLVLAWTACLGLERDAAAIRFGLLLTLATFMSYILLIVGYFLSVQTILFLARDGRAGLVATLRSAVIAVATVGAVYFALWACWGYDPIATYRSIAFLQEKDLIHLGRPWPLHMIWDVYDFALASGWISCVLVACLLTSGLRYLSALARTLTLISLSQIAVVAVASFLPGESARLWMLLLPFLMPAIGFELARWRPVDRLAVYLALLMMTTAIAQNMIFLNMGTVDR